MEPLFFANWRMIHQRFCLLLWLVAMALVVVILAHFVAASAACATSARSHAAACAPHPPGPHRFNH
jgi:hypothetical protein